MGMWRIASMLLACLLVEVTLPSCVPLADASTDAPTPSVVMIWEVGEAGLYPLAIEAGLGCPRMVWRDMEYREASRKSIEELSSGTQTDKLRRTRFFDCDDFALIFDANIHKWCAGIAAGQVCYIRSDGVKHAVNIIVMDGKFWLFEARTDKLFEVLEGEVCWFLF